MGIEPMASSLPRKRSTPELHWLIKKKSGRRGSNPRPSAWKADALPTELLPQFVYYIQKKWGEQDSNLRRRAPADLQSAPVGHFGISPFSSIRSKNLYMF